MSLSRPLIPDRKRYSEAAGFHAQIFAAYGSKCWRCKAQASDAAHIISRAKLGPHRYAAPLANGRPLCRACHDQQEAGTWDFPGFMRQRAIDALNKVLKVKI